MVRGIGPGLAQFGVTEYLADPRLDVFSGDTLQHSNDDWGNPLGERFGIADTAAAVGGGLCVTLKRGPYRP